MGGCATRHLPLNFFAFRGKPVEFVDRSLDLKQQVVGLKIIHRLKLVMGEQPIFINLQN